MSSRQSLAQHELYKLVGGHSCCGQVLASRQISPLALQSRAGHGRVGAHVPRLQHELHDMYLRPAGCSAYSALYNTRLPSSTCRCICICICAARAGKRRLAIIFDVTCSIAFMLHSLSFLSIQLCHGRGLESLAYMYSAESEAIAWQVRHMYRHLHSIRDLMRFK